VGWRFTVRGLPGRRYLLGRSLIIDDHLLWLLWLLGCESEGSNPANKSEAEKHIENADSNQVGTVFPNGENCREEIASQSNGSHDNKQEKFDGLELVRSCVCVHKVLFPR
jgi:hypothetical protein